MKVSLAQAGIVAGVLTLAWSVGGPKEVYSAHSAESLEMIECGNCDATFTIDEGLDIGGIDYCEECYDTISVKEDTEWRWNNGEKVLCCCGEPTRDADFCPEGGYNRSGDECKFECGHEECEAEMKAKYGAESEDENIVCASHLDGWRYCDEDMDGRAYPEPCVVCDKKYCKNCWKRGERKDNICERCYTASGARKIDDEERWQRYLKLQEERRKSMGWLKRKWHGLAEDEDTTTCEDCGVKIGYDEAIDWEGLDRCEDCYDYWMMKDRQNYTGDETDCISCGYSISPNDVRFELVEGLCPDCKADGSFQAEEFDRSNISVPKDWVPKKYPYDRRVVAETKSKWCENCGELDDSEEDAWNHYQFFLKQKNSTKPAMRFISGGACEGCGADLCQNCMDGATSGNFNPLFEPMCDDCGYPFCKECKTEDRCDNCEEEHESNRCDCCGHVHYAESKKLNPIEKPIISGAASGATIEGLEDLMMSEPYDSEDCPLCLEKIDFRDAYEEPDNYDLCDSCDEAVQEKRQDHAYSAEAVADSDVQITLSKQRTAMSAMRTAFAGMGLFLAYDIYKDRKQIK